MNFEPRFRQEYSSKDNNISVDSFANFWDRHSRDSTFLSPPNNMTPIGSYESNDYFRDATRDNQVKPGDEGP